MSKDKIPLFEWTAVGDDGQRTRGRMEASSSREVVSILKQQQMTPISVKQRRNSVLDVNIGGDKRESKMSAGELAAFARQLQLLLQAGLSVPRALSVMGEDADRGKLKTICRDLAERTTAGVPLSKAMTEFEKTFGEVVVAYIAAGEATGDMERAIARLARTQEKNHQLRLKVKSVTAYPKMVAGAIALLVVGIIAFLVPRYASIYDGLGQKLPAPTRALISLSQQLQPFNFSIGFSLGGGIPLKLDLIPDGESVLTAPINLLSPTTWIIGAVVGWVVFRRKTKDNIVVGSRLDRIRWRTPLIGKLSKATTLFRWSSTLAGALGSGLQMFVALDLAGRTSGSPMVRLISADLQEAVRAGRQLSGELAAYPRLFNAQLRAMAATGEEAGEPAVMFNNIAVTIEDELEAMVATLGAKIEVALLMLMGVVVGSLLVVLYLPILGLSNAVGEGFSQ